MTSNVWANAVALEGLDLRDKAELVDLTFVITGIWFETNNSGINYVYVEAETQDGEQFSFNDSSSGVRVDIIEHLAKTGQDHIIESGEVLAVALLIPRGLRASNYEIEEKNAAGRPTGRKRQARTYYLTKSGKRRAVAPVADIKPAARKVAATKA